MAPITLIHAIFAAPIAAAVLIVLFALKRPRLAASVSLAANALALILVFWVLQTTPNLSISQEIPWLTLGNLTINIGYWITPQALLMLFIVTFLGFWIQFFSLSYMQHDAARGRYFAEISLFLFAMLGIVLASNLFMLFVFWELVGLGSYLLIAHYWETPEAASASKKAFIVNRIGDWGFLLGIIGCFWKYGTTNLQQLQQVAPLGPLSAGLALLLMCGFIGKSAQFPLQVWLPDAMAGPTPVSALIHAATMVAAGIYFLCRIECLFPESVLLLITTLGAFMALYAGLCALTQSDIKRVLAYSTLSQLGTMATAFGLGYSGLALMHLSTHAFFKALLFLGAGAVIAQTQHEQNLFNLGGLRRRMPFTTACFLMGAVALMGAGFGDLLVSSGGASKHLILEAAWLKQPWIYGLLWLSGMVTALYVTRLFVLAFLGLPRSSKAQKAQEATWVMLLPLCVLTLYATFVGFRYLLPGNLSGLFDVDILRLHHELKSTHGPWNFFGLQLLPNLSWMSGLALGGLYYYREGLLTQLSKEPFPRLLRALPNADALYDACLIRPKTFLCNVLHILESVVLGGIVVRGSTIIVRHIGTWVKTASTASLNTYAYWTLLGVALLLILRIF